MGQEISRRTFLRGGIAAAAGLAAGSIPAVATAAAPQQETQLAKETNGYLYGEKENGGTNTIYVSPVPFEELNKTIEKGKGKPHLRPVKDTMAQANNLTAAMVLAPVAGIAAAVGKFVKLTKSSE